MDRTLAGRESWPIYGGVGSSAAASLTAPLQLSTRKSMRKSSMRRIPSASRRRISAAQTLSRSTGGSRGSSASSPSSRPL
eukprot:scaffold1208_cov231-Pinguiococcus_pyrenoidosus.AAC.4